MQEVESLRLSIPSQQHEIFLDYTNANFSQTVIYHKNKNRITADIEITDFLSLDLNYRVIPRGEYIETLSPTLQQVIKSLFDESQSLRNYLLRISSFLKKNIHYTEKELPQDAEAVIFNRQANCIGFSNLVTVFFNAAGIQSKIVRGFYLKKSKKESLTPIPHRWVELRLSDGSNFFYDPQYQDFSANYIATRSDVDFKQVRRFKVNVIRKSKKFYN